MTTHALGRRAGPARAAGRSGRARVRPHAGGRRAQGRIAGPYRACPAAHAARALAGDAARQGRQPFPMATPSRSCLAASSIRSASMASTRPSGGNRSATKAREMTGQLAFGKQVTVEVVDVDRYGRVVGEVFLPGGRHLNPELVRAGLAWWYREYAAYEDHLEKLEQEARAAKRGLWADEHPVPPWQWRAERQGGSEPEKQVEPGLVAPGTRVAASRGRRFTAGCGRGRPLAQHRHGRPPQPLVHELRPDEAWPTVRPERGQALRHLRRVDMATPSRELAASGWARRPRGLSAIPCVCRSM